MNVNDLVDQLAKLDIKPSIHDHPVVNSLPAWIETINGIDPQAIPTKTTIFKSKGGNVSAIIAFSLESKKYSGSALAKAIGAKDARAGTEEFVFELLGVGRLDATIFSASNLKSSEGVVIVVDDEIMKGISVNLAFRAFAGDKSLFISSADVKKFIESFESKIEVLDLDNLTNKGKDEKAEKEKKSKKSKNNKEEDSEEKEVLIGLTVKKEENFPKWYEQVLTKAELMDYYDVSGCYIIRPSAFSIWKRIQAFFSAEIEEMGVQDCYFPMFITEGKLNKEKDHVEGFSPEVAWVTRSGKSEFAEPIAIRPTSETAMYPYFANWIQSHRDLPLRLNQWCNVIRWEFSNPQPFLRTREFLWQEGHTAFGTLEEAKIEVAQILELYRRVYEELLAIPVVPGTKSEKEKFAGALYTTSVEGFITATGRGIQGATSHCLGQNFSKMFNIMASDENAERSFVWQNSWGLSTRSIGVVIMVHSDDKGLVLPPRVAQLQVIVVPCGITAKTTEETKSSIFKAAENLVGELKKGGIRAQTDLRENYTPGFKFNHWELRGVPIRLEIGPRDLERNETRCVLRYNGDAKQLSLVNISSTIAATLEEIQSEMYQKAKKLRDSRMVRLETWDGFVETLNKKCMIMAPWCEKVKCEEAVKERSAKVAQVEGEPIDEKAPSMGAKTLNIPHDQSSYKLKEGQKCFACDDLAIRYALWGRSY